MFIIVEGPNGAGKTTVAQRIREWTGLPVYRTLGRPGVPAIPPPWADLVVADLYRQASFHIVSDRSLWSWIVYNQPNEWGAIFEEWQRALLARPPVYLAYVTAPLETLVVRTGRSEAELRSVLERYEDTWNTLPWELPRRRFDTSVEPDRSVRRTVLREVYQQYQLPEEVWLQ